MAYIQREREREREKQTKKSLKDFGKATRRLDKNLKDLGWDSFWRGLVIIAFPIVTMIGIAILVAIVL